jgi:hypothetical protein
MSKQRLNGRGWPAGTRFVILLVIGILWALPATARDRPVILIGIVDSPQDSETGPAVGDVERLHDVLDKLWNDPAALGLTSSSATIRLAAHAIYRLDPTKWEAGRVRLAPGTAIRGGNQYTDDRDEDGIPGSDGIPDEIEVDGNTFFASQETILDGRFLTGERAVIEAGLANSIRNLTVWGARDPVPGGTNRPGAEIRLLLTDQDNVGSLEVDGVICEKGRRGIHVVGATGAQMYLTARRSIVRDHADPLDFAWGVQESTSANVSGFRLSATLRHNRIYNNRIGIFLASVGTRDGEFILNTHHNVIEENNLGIQSLIRDFNSPQGSLRNRTRIHSINDMIWNNGPDGGVLAVGYQRDANGVEIRNNETELQFLGTRFVKLTASGAFDGLQNRRTINQVPRRTDLRIVGAGLSAPGLTGPTSGMSVSLLLRQATSSLMPTTYDPAPPLQPISINDNAPDVVDITIIGSQKRYLRTNEGVNELDESLFSRRR